MEESALAPSEAMIERADMTNLQTDTLTTKMSEVSVDLNSAVCDARSVELRAFPTMFGQIREQDVTFCIDTSGSMYKYLDAVKEHLIEALLTLAHRDSDCTFNVIEFSTNVMQWSDKMVRCTPQTVAVAAQWIKELHPKTGTNTMDALLSAFSDGACCAVCLVTDGIPDQEATEVLDNVVYAAQNRAVHCFYVQNGKPDDDATQFLQDLSMETYGSFHIITVAEQGAVERITPVYRAECTAEQIVRTDTGGIVTVNDKLCSMTTTLNHIPRVTESPIVIPSLAAAIPYPAYPYYMYPWPFRHYYRHYTPVGSWSRYRPARSWMKESRELIDSGIDFAPGPGSMLIGMKVLARRAADGLFYLGKVKSQVQNHKFLVEFCPSQHGRWKDTTYQETFIYDIVSYDDAMRHAVLVQDKVLAPWDPEEEQFGPGIVIEGQERRSAEGGGSDRSLVVAFFNGKTATVPASTAVWIPPALHERAEFELRLPRNVRKEFSKQAFYPEENLPGYPTSGTGAVPRDYDVVTSQWLDKPDHVFANSYFPHHIRRYPVYYKCPENRSAIRSEDIETIIPGTELTKSALNEKVMSQLMKYKMLLVDKEAECEQETDKLLNRRHNTETKSILKHSFNKSVSFQRPDSDVEAEFDAGDLEIRDSGRGSLSISDGECCSDPEMRQTPTSVYDTDSDLYYCSRRRSRPRSRSAGRTRSRSRSRSKSCERPAWRYWNNEPAPEMMDPMHYGPYRVGPYEESVAPVPLEIREQMMGPYGVEWNAALGKYVDCFAKNKQDGGVRDSIGYLPHPPTSKPDKQCPGVDISLALGGNLSQPEQLALARREFRRRRAIGREEDWQKRVIDEDKMTLVMRDQHRERILEQMSRDRSRQEDEINKVAAHRDAKKSINEQLRGRIESNIDRQREIGEQRLEAARGARARRDEIATQRRQEIEQKMARGQEARKYNTDKRWHGHCAQLAQHDSDQATVDAQRQTAKAHRLQGFRRREERHQTVKDLMRHTNNQSTAIFRSQVLP